MHAPFSLEHSVTVKEMPKVDMKVKAIRKLRQEDLKAQGQLE